MTGPLIWLAEEMVNLANLDFSVWLMGPKRSHKIGKSGWTISLAEIGDVLQGKCFISYSMDYKCTT
jgi:hypothetical protein